MVNLCSANLCSADPCSIAVPFPAHNARSGLPPLHPYGYHFASRAVFLHRICPASPAIDQLSWFNFTTHYTHPFCPVDSTGCVNRVKASWTPFYPHFLWLCDQLEIYYACVFCQHELSQKEVLQRSDTHIYMCSGVALYCHHSAGHVVSHSERAIRRSILLSRMKRDRLHPHDPLEGLFYLCTCVSAFV